MVELQNGCDDTVMTSEIEPTCELRLRGDWVEIALSEALRLHPSREKRCPECNGQVRAHKAAENGMRAHFEHYEANPGCSLGPIFSGAPSPHRKPLT